MRTNHLWNPVSCFYLCVVNQHSCESQWGDQSSTQHPRPHHLAQVDQGHRLNVQAAPSWRWGTCWSRTSQSLKTKALGPPRKAEQNIGLKRSLSSPGPAGMKGEKGTQGLVGLSGAPGLKGQKGEPGAKGKASGCDLWVLRRGPVVRALGVRGTRGVEGYWLPGQVLCWDGPQPRAHGRERGTAWASRGADT